MKITLSQSEIEQAVRKHINEILTLVPGTNIVVDFFTPRGSNDINATIDLLPANQEKATTINKVIVTPAKETPTLAVVETESVSQNIAKEEPMRTEIPVEIIAEETDVSTDKPKSLFGNLSRPKNA